MILYLMAADGPRGYPRQNAQQDYFRERGERGEREREREYQASDVKELTEADVTRISKSVFREQVPPTVSAAVAQEVSYMKDKVVQTALLDLRRDATNRLMPDITRDVKERMRQDVLRPLEEELKEELKGAVEAEKAKIRNSLSPYNVTYQMERVMREESPKFVRKAIDQHVGNAARELLVEKEQLIQGRAELVNNLREQNTSLSAELQTTKRELADLKTIFGIEHEDFIRLQERLNFLENMHRIEKTALEEKHRLEVGNLSMQINHVRHIGDIRIEALEKALREKTKEVEDLKQKARPNTPILNFVEELEGVREDLQG